MMMSQSLFLIFIISILVHSSSSSLTTTTAAAGVIIRLERSYPANHPISALRAKDHSRRLLLLQADSDSDTSSVVDIPTFNHSGLYYAKVLLGSPPKEFFVQIDTGSDALWVSCKACTGCSRNDIYYDESVSSTSYLISCSDQICSRAPHTCKIINHEAMCSYTLRHSSGTEASGYYVSDVIHLTINGTSNAPPTIFFGCSTSVAQPQGRLDGVFGFGRQSFSVINQLYTQGVRPHVFSHCLAGSDSVIGGGILAIGYPQEPKIVYTPLIPDSINFDVTLESISIDRRTLPINQSTFKQGRTRFDSGTTLAYVARGAYLQLLDAVTKTVTYYVDYIQPTIIDGIQCYLSDHSVDGLFPGITLNFAGNTSMLLYQQDYLVQQRSRGDLEVWCIGFMESTNQDTTLGDLFLRDKLVVYDLERQRIGWTNYNCAKLINATTTTPSSGVATTPPTTSPSSGVTSKQEILLTHLLIVLHLSFVALY